MDSALDLIINELFRIFHIKFIDIIKTYIAINLIIIILKLDPFIDYYLSVYQRGVDIIKGKC